MPRKLMLVLAFLAVVGQALAGAAFATAGAGDVGHLLEHAQEQAHHHGAGGDLHVGEPGDSFFHVHVDGANALGLPAWRPLQAGTPAPQGPPAVERVALPSPWLDGLLRPPKS